MPYTLLHDGDDYEKHYWTKFLSSDFPSYQTYWADKITPLTNRPNNIHFKSSAELIALGHSAEEVCKAQLHYTIFRHLKRAYEILVHLQNKIQVVNDTDYLGEGLYHICSAQDVAFEFLQRNKTPNQFDAWTPKKKFSTTGNSGSEGALRRWQSENNNPLQDIREYRNHITHGRMSPSILQQGKVLLPKIGLEIIYLDWRIITDNYPSSQVVSDFDSLDKILSSAWLATLAYFEAEWKNI